MISRLRLLTATPARLANRRTATTMTTDNAAVNAGARVKPTSNESPTTPRPFLDRDTPDLSGARAPLVNISTEILSALAFASVIGFAWNKFVAWDVRDKILAYHDKLEGMKRRQESALVAAGHKL